MELARRGARIIMLSRDMKKAEAAAVEIRLVNKLTSTLMTSRFEPLT
jgi:hypothetical protein